MALSEQDQQQTAALQSHIGEAIAAAGGQIPFAEFMQAALYTPELGYYSSNLTKFGPAGDFITAPELGPLFAQCLASQCQQVLSEMTAGNIIEFGAGSGQLAIDLLQSLETLDCLPSHYYIVELSGHLRAQQQHVLRQAIPQLAERVIWLDSLPKQAIEGVIIANEVLDAMPVHRFRIQADRIEEGYVRLEQGHFTQHYDKPSSPGLSTDIAALDIECPEGLNYASEINLNLQGWLASCFALLSRGTMLLIDYGYSQQEYYHPSRNQGTLMCHYQHHSHPDPLINVGLQDITAHVDFSRVAELAFRQGWSVRGYTTQANFLLANDLLAWSAKTAQTEREQFTLNQAIKTLTLPHEMGELFKVMALGKDCDMVLNGFQLRDMRERL